MTSFLFLVSLSGITGFCEKSEGNKQLNSRKTTSSSKAISRVTNPHIVGCSFVIELDKNKKNLNPPFLCLFMNIHTAVRLAVAESWKTNN